MLGIALKRSYLDPNNDFSSEDEFIDYIVAVIHRYQSQRYHVYNGVARINRLNSDRPGAFQDQVGQKPDSLEFLRGEMREALSKMRDAAVGSQKQLAAHFNAHTHSLFFPEGRDDMAPREHERRLIDGTIHGLQSRTKGNERSLIIIKDGGSLTDKLIIEEAARQKIPVVMLTTRLGVGGCMYYRELIDNGGRFFVFYSESDLEQFLSNYGDQHETIQRIEFSGR
jgi:hypothetical protein